jgi:hypothetical protein
MSMNDATAKTEVTVKPAAEQAPYYSGVANRIASADGNWLLQLQNDGSVEVRYRGTHDRWL